MSSSGNIQEPPQGTNYKNKDCFIAIIEWETLHDFPGTLPAYVHIFMTGFIHLGEFVYDTSFTWPEDTLSFLEATYFRALKKMIRRHERKSESDVASGEKAGARGLVFEQASTPARLPLIDKWAGPLCSDRTTWLFWFQLSWYGQTNSVNRPQWVHSTHFNHLRLITYWFSALCGLQLQKQAALCWGTAVFVYLDPFILHMCTIRSYLLPLCRPDAALKSSELFPAATHDN